MHWMMLGGIVGEFFWDYSFKKVGLAEWVAKIWVYTKGYLPPNDFGLTSKTLRAKLHGLLYALIQKRGT